MAEQSLGPQARRYILGLGAAAALAMALGGCQLVPKQRPERLPEPELPEAQPEPEEPRGPQLPPEETRNRVAVLVPISGTSFSRAIGATARTSSASKGPRNSPLPAATASVAAAAAPLLAVS